MRVAVAGAVTLDGRPLEGAAVTFMPAVAGRPGVAVTDAAGRFALQENGMHEGVVPGDYDVVITKIEGGAADTVVPPVPAGAMNREAFIASRPPPVPPQLTRNLIPERYAARNTSGLRVTVTGPVSDLVFALTTKTP